MKPGYALAAGAAAHSIGHAAISRIVQVVWFVLFSLLAFAVVSAPGRTASPGGGAISLEPPELLAQITAGALPPRRQRLPISPRVIDPRHVGGSLGRYGGHMRWLMGKPKDLKMVYYYGYTRLVTYDRNYELVPDVLLDFAVKDERVFTLRLRPGHKWSDGSPLTAEDFRYAWEDVLLDPRMKMMMPASLLVDGQPPKFEVLDQFTVRYSWTSPNAEFLTGLAATLPLQIVVPSRFLKQFHPRYAPAAQLAARMAQHKQGSAAALHRQMCNASMFRHPERPTLGPWLNTTEPPSSMYVFKRNPYFHRADPAGRQLPYVGEVRILIVQPGLVPAKTGTGESDLQARYLRFDDYTFLKAAERQGRAIKVHLWERANGSHIALFPNLTTEDEVWRRLLRDVRMRRALSLAIDREEINKAIFFGLARESGDTILPRSPLYKPEFASRWTHFDIAEANRLLDEMGLTKRTYDGLRVLPDGRRAEIIVDTAGESTEQSDILGLIKDSWRQIGIALFPRPTQRDLFRSRAYSGQSIMSVWSGHDNGLPVPSTRPDFLAPTSRAQLQWPDWGLYAQTHGAQGTPPALPAAQKLLDLLGAWRKAETRVQQTAIWQEMLQIYADNLFSIGIVSGTKQPVVVARALQNVPTDGVFAFEPGGYFGIYHPETFWFKPVGASPASAAMPAAGGLAGGVQDGAK